MKKIFATFVIAASFVACAQNEKKDSDSTTTESNSTTTTPSDNGSSREQEIADSTKLLDKKLADENDPSTPDSLK